MFRMLFAPGTVFFEDQLVRGVKFVFFRHVVLPLADTADESVELPLGFGSHFCIIPTQGACWQQLRLLPRGRINLAPHQSNGCGRHH